MSPGDILSRAARPPDHVLRYGPGREQVADLRLPPGDRSTEKAEATVLNSGKEPETRPLVIFLHGGFWRSAYDRGHVGPLSEALAAAGFAVCAPEYRRTGQPGGGWPGTFDDVAAAVDALPDLAAQASGGVADSSRVVLAGHSAGGHLALWAASRGRLPASAPWHARRSSRPAVAGVVSLAGVCDLAACYRLGLDGDAAGDLMGGGPERFPDRYRAADPMSLVPAAAPAWLVHGTVDDRVPDSQSRDYADRAAAVGGQVHVAVLPGYGHFEVIDPLSAVWAVVLGAFQAAAGGQVMPGLEADGTA